MRMLLMHENMIVGKFSLESNELLILGRPSPPIGEPTVSNLLAWLASRVSPYAITDRLGIPYYGVSFTDNFWVCESSEAIFFDNIHAFSQADIPPNPESIVMHNCFSIVKRYTPNEYYAFHVAQIVGMPTVQYYPFNKLLVSPILSNLRESWFSIADLGCFKEVYKRFPTEVHNMIVFDALVGNVGRSLSNISVVCDPCSQLIKRLAPSYSLHSTFHFVEDVHSLWSNDLEQKVKDVRNNISIKPSNLLPHLTKFPKRMQHILYHNLIQLNLV